jgi:hypothetical protein
MATYNNAHVTLISNRLIGVANTWCTGTVFFLAQLIFCVTRGRAIAQAVSRWFHTAAARVQTRV